VRRCIRHLLQLCGHNALLLRGAGRRSRSHGLFFNHQGPQQLQALQTQWLVGWQIANGRKQLRRDEERAGEGGGRHACTRCSRGGG
jgi:hypothetical protein